MISVLQPTITVTRVDNGWFVQWTRRSHKDKSKFEIIESVATSPEDFFSLVKRASDDVEELRK